MGVLGATAWVTLWPRLHSAKDSALVSGGALGTWPRLGMARGREEPEGG